MPVWIMYDLMCIERLCIGFMCAELLCVGLVCRLRNKDLYADFLKVLSLYSVEVISVNELMTLVSDVFGRNNELIVSSVVHV